MYKLLFEACVKALKKDYLKHNSQTAKWKTDVAWPNILNWAVSAPLRPLMELRPGWKCVFTSERQDDKLGTVYDMRIIVREINDLYRFIYLFCLVRSQPQVGDISSYSMKLNLL